MLFRSANTTTATTTTATTSPATTTPATTVNGTNEYIKDLFNNLVDKDDDREKRLNSRKNDASIKQKDDYFLRVAFPPTCAFAYALNKAAAK